MVRDDVGTEQPEVGAGADTVAELSAALAASRQREAALQGQVTALAEVLRVIATSPNDLDHVLQIIARTARRLCGADGAAVHQREGERLRTRGIDMAGEDPAVASERITPPRTIERGVVGGRALIDRQTVHVPDIDAVADEYSAGPSDRAPGRLASAGCRATAARRGRVWRTLPVRARARPVQPGADRAAGDVRRSGRARHRERPSLREVEQRNTELQESNRQVSESLEQQTRWPTFSESLLHHRRTSNPSLMRSWSGPHDSPMRPERWSGVWTGGCFTLKPPSTLGRQTNVGGHGRRSVQSIGPVRLGRRP